MNEEIKEIASKKSAGVYAHGVTQPVAINEISTTDEERYHTGLTELDRV